MPPRIHSADSLAQARLRPRRLKPRLVAKSRLSEPLEPLPRVATPELSIRSISVDLTLRSHFYWPLVRLTCFLNCGCVPPEVRLAAQADELSTWQRQPAASDIS